MDTLSVPRTSACRAGTRNSLARILDAAFADHPDRCAIRAETEQLTYRELHRRATQVAARLRSDGIGPGAVVGVRVPRSVAAIVAIHAVVATGAVVAPLDVTDSGTRMRSLIGQANISHVLVPEGLRDDSLFDGQQVPVGGGLSLVRTGSAAGSAEPGYLLFTSGSTGTPKGVLLSSAAVAHFARWAAGSVDLQPGDRIAAQAAFTFDLSTFDIFATAVAGATVALLPEWLKAFPRDTVDWLAAEEITAIYAVPTLLKGIVAAAVAGRQPLAALRAVVFAGEPYPASELHELLVAFPDIAVRNWYGPTETNVCTAADVRVWTPGHPVPIGEPISGVQTCIVDDDLQPSEVGELVVAGPTLLTGYVVGGAVIDPAVEVLFPDGRVRRAYRTGDRAHRGDNGELILLGRADRQIKRRGYRIDLSGIEAIAAESASSAAVATGPDNRITLFVDVDPVAPAGVLDAVNDALRQRLPSISQPDRIVAHSPLPTNSRGKIDRATLEDLAAQSLTDQEISL